MHPLTSIAISPYIFLLQVVFLLNESLPVIRGVWHQLYEPSTSSSLKPLLSVFLLNTSLEGLLKRLFTS